MPGAPRRNPNGVTTYVPNPTPTQGSVGGPGTPSPIGMGGGGGSSSFDPRSMPPAGSPGPKGRVTQPGGTSNAWLDELMEFYRQMMGPLDQNDPRVAAILNSAYSNGMQTASNRGIGGPLATTGAQQSLIGAGTQLMNQRQGMGLQALGAGLQQHNTDRSFAADQAWRQYQADQDAYNARQGNMQGLGAGILGGIGAVGGGIVGGLVGGPVGVGIGAGVGGQALGSIGAGIGGMGWGGNFPSYNPKPLGPGPSQMPYSLPKPKPFGGF